MSLFFLDTSALTKYYRRESGSDLIERLFEDQGSQRIISQLARIEIESAFAIKVRTGELGVGEVRRARERIASDLERRVILLSAIRENDFQAARTLVKKHGIDPGLRTLDALQLATASHIRNSGFAPIFITADRRLSRVAEIEGFVVINPEEPTPLII